MDVHLELLHGAENAFGILDDRAGDRHSDDAYAGIATALKETDGLLVLLPPASARANVRMRMFNPDGSEAEMCGNGIRCVARYLSDRGEGGRFLIETAAGDIGARVLSGTPYMVETDIGVPRVGEERRLEAGGQEWAYVPVSVGNPHAIVFVDDVDAIDLGHWGPSLSTHRDFPGGANVHFVKVIDSATLRVVHWERGAGATRACGTGIVASAAAAMQYRGVSSPVTVSVPGGVLTVVWDAGGPALLTGPVERTGARELAVT
ncbi:MAG: diaminopimelate epimerase [Vulcanimicrobiaceae bacterium]